MCVTSYNALKTSLRHIIQEHGNFPGGKQESAPDENHIIHRYDYDKTPLATLTEGREKSLICTRIATYMDIENSSCTDDFVGQDQVMNGDYFKDHKSFSKNGIDWFITTNRVPDNNTPSEYRTDVYIDVNGENGDNCLYNADTCKTPDRFKFTILANGRVVPADAVSNEYIRTQHSWFKNNGANFDDFNDNIIAGITQIQGEQVCEKCYVRDPNQADFACVLNDADPACQTPPPSGPVVIFLTSTPIYPETPQNQGLSEPCAKYLGEGMRGGTYYVDNNTRINLREEGGHCVGRGSTADIEGFVDKYNQHHNDYWVDGDWYSEAQYNAKFTITEKSSITPLPTIGYKIIATVTSGTVSDPIDIYYTDRKNIQNGCRISSASGCTIEISEGFIDYNNMSVVSEFGKDAGVKFDWDGKDTKGREKKPSTDAFDPNKM